MNKPLMISRRHTLEGSLALGLASAMPVRAAAASGISALVDAGKASHPISDYMFGGFIEHIANLINYSFGSEVLHDRKF